jgi:hypothetical protein
MVEESMFQSFRNVMIMMMTSRNNNHPTNQKKKKDDEDTAATAGGREDTWIDHALDRLREHRLPPVVEVVASWQVAVACIAYYGYSYLRSLTILWTKRRIRGSSAPVVVPLTTDARRRRRRCVDDDWLVSLLVARTKRNDKNDDDEFLSLHELCQLSAEALIANVRGDLSLRRLVSRFMTTTMMNRETTRPITTASTSTTADADVSTSTTAFWCTTTAAANDEDAVVNHYNNDNQVLQSRLLAVWPRLLEFPPIIMEQSLLPLQDDSGGGGATAPYFDISLIIPAYREASERIVWTLDMALRRCDNDPKRIQVIIVQVVVLAVVAAVVRGPDDDDDPNRLQSLLVRAGHMTAWGDVTTVRYHHNQDGGGRGPAQNFGARFARGILLTFLHADTVIPIHWDRKVYETLLGRNNNGDQQQQPGPGRIVQACAFSFGHNTEQLDGMSYPWGIRAVWLLGNLRAYFFRLPYGDHVLSIPTTYFRYLGGFPEQPIMEDYDLMDLLRKRAAVVKGEGIRIIPPPTAQCSVRRWQRFGTVYVTLVNALLVHRYSQGGWTADDVYEYYYERPTTTTTGANNSLNKERTKK